MTGPQWKTKFSAPKPRVPTGSGSSVFRVVRPLALGFGDCGGCASHSFWPVGRGLARQLWSLIGLPKVRICGRCGHVAQGRVCVVDAAVVGLVVPVLLEVDIMLGQGVAAVALLRGYAMRGGRARLCAPVHSWKSGGPGDPVVSAFA